MIKHKVTVQPIEKSRISEVDFNNLPFGKIFADHMFLSEYEGAKWHNPRIEPLSPLKMHPASTVLHYGQAIFEGMKAERNATGNPIMFRPLENIRRFNRSAVRMAMPQIPEDLFIEALEKLLALDKNWIPDGEGQSLYIRPFMFASDEYVGIKVSDRYVFGIFTSPVGKYYPKPVKVFLTKDFVRAFPGGVGSAKAAGNYGATLYPAMIAQKKGYDQILWLDGIEKKYFQEIGTMNVFFIINDILITPNLEEGAILAGVTRASLIEIAKDFGYKVEERKISVDEVLDAHADGSLQDAFGAGTAATLSHISAIGTDEKEYQLPPIEDRHVSNRLKAELTGLKNGTIPDRFGWIHEVKHKETVNGSSVLAG